jgi:hypothetical protein
MCNRPEGRERSTLLPKRLIKFFDGLLNFREVI